MKTSAITASLILTGALAGCATAVPIVDFYDSDSDTLRRFQTITVLDDAFRNAKNLETLGDVEGIFCNKSSRQVSVNDPLARAKAVDQVKLKAAKKGAHYITTPLCLIRVGADLTNNCYSTLVCTASALAVND
jgi:hypothetical protein